MADFRGGDAGGHHNNPHHHHKGKGHHAKAPKRTAAQKRERMSGRNTNKPYISSSMGDMVRLMQRMACTENTLGMTEPPPPEFYDFWTKFAASKSEEHLPIEYVDKRKVSVARLKMNTSSFDFTGKHTINANELHEMALAELGKRKGGGGAVAGSERWNDVRISMSTESFISSSTKVSESHEVTSLYHGWSDSDGEDNLESDADMNATHASVTSMFHNIFPHQSSHHAGEASKFGDKAVSSKHGNLNKSQGSDENVKGVSSLLQMILEDQRVAMEQSLKNTKAEHEIVDYFMDDLDDSFLVDAISYGQLPDSAFTPDFDYFNEDPLHRQRERAKHAAEVAALQPKGKGNKTKPPTAEDTVALSGESDEEEPEPEDKVVKLRDDTCTRIDYATCIQAQRRRIEDRLKAAVRKRSPMGSYKVPKGGKPLTHVGATPGPADYFPDLNAVKPGPKGVNLVNRWKKSIYETPGPGPGAYYPDCAKCTGEYNLSHFSPRFPQDETDGPGPAAYDTVNYHGTATDKPHALILSRHPWFKSQTEGCSFPNIYGMTRFGKHRPPNPVLVSKPFMKDRTELGPGAYDPYPPKDTRVGITLKSRIPELSRGMNPGFLDLPTFMGTGPGVPLGIRKFTNINSDSPGPIYGVKPAPLGGISMTFKPFPTRGRESDPCPIEYGTKPGEMSLKNEFKRAPDPVMIGSHNFDYGIDKTPGPADYKVKQSNKKIGIKIKGRYGFKTETGPGPADYKIKDVRNTRGAGFKSKPKERPESERSPGFIYTPKDPNHKTSRGIFIAGKWPTKEDDESGPPYYNVFGLTSRGNYSKIPISLKSRHSPAVFTHVSTNATLVKQCADVINPPAAPTIAPKSAKC